MRHSYSFLLLIALCFSFCTAPNEPADSQIDDDEASEQHSSSSLDVDRRLDSLGIELPEASTPVANYVNAVTTGKLVFLAGKGPKQADGTYITGKVDRDLSTEEGYAAARLTAINQLAALKAEIGNLNRVKRDRKSTWHGQRHSGVHRPSGGDQRVFPI